LAQFYKELKELRESRNITLKEISERTKINVQYLQHIESGDFTEIEIPYLRLFLRAYAEEIGGESQRALEQLDSFMGNNRPTVISTNSIEEDTEENNKENKSQIKTNKKIRQDYLIAGGFSLIFIFSIFVSKKIFNKESNAYGTNDGPVIKENVKPLNDDDLLKDFVLDQSSNEMLTVSPPFFVKFKTIQQIAYTFKNDTLPPIANIINPNRELDLNAFIEPSELIFTSTIGLTLFINATEIKQISGSDFPLRLIINPNPPSIAIQRYKPLF